MSSSPLSPLLLLPLLPALTTLSACDPAPAPEGAVTTVEPAEIDAWDDAPEGPNVQVVADLTDPSTGRVQVTMRYSDLPNHMDAFRALGKEPELTYFDVRFSTPDGDRIGHDQDGRTFKLNGMHKRDVVIQYSVEPGGDGRHGKQGIVDPDWAMFDGRVFLVPVGGGGLRGGRVRFDAPEGWVTASPLPEADGWLDLGVYGKDRVLTALTGTCYGVGPFEEKKIQLGKSTVGAWVYGEWPEPTKQQLLDGTLDLYRWFHTDLSFDPGFPMAVVWSPKHEEKRVYGGSSANGTCMEQPRPNLRAWQLMAHRVGHSMNKYAPSGMHLHNNEDSWFKEGWPSYIELIATEGAGLTDQSTRWNTLYEDTVRTRRKYPERDLAMKDEPQARGESTEYMHYFKGPVVVMLLDDWIQRRYDKNLTDFMAAMWVKYGQYNKPLPLRQELEAYVGASLDDFWGLFVDQRGWVYPVWKEALTDKVKLASQQPGAATVAGRPVSGDYLHYLASTGDFEYFAEIVDFLESEEPRRQQLADAGVALLPPSHDAVRAGFQPEARYSLVRAEAAYPLPSGPPAPTDDQRIVFDTEDPDGRLFAQLLADEAAYEASVLPSGIEELTIQLRDDEGNYSTDPLLVFGTKDEIRLQTAWAAPAGQVTVRAYRGDDVSNERTPTVWPDWTRSWSPFSTGQLPKGSGIVTFEVKTDAGHTVARSFWRRDR